MIEHIVIAIVLVLALGSSAQWLAWRFNIPSILLLLLFGFAAGPVLGVIPPESLQGEWVYAFVSLSIGIILFEGGLSLQISELREVGSAVRNLITVGVVVTWILATLAAFFILGFDTSLSILIGAILTVTGPTVVIPLLRQVKPRGRVGVVARWEGITIDPVGAVLAVLVLEAILLLNDPARTGSGISGAVFHTVQGLLATVLVGGIISLAGASLLVFLLYRRLVPDYLQGTIALVIVAGTFALANVLRQESGLLEATLMGIMIANQKYVPVRRISEFKENLQVLLIGSLFIVLSARLKLDVLVHIGVSTLIFLLVLILVIRPAAVFFSSIGTDLNWREKVFLSWLAPRGIVAAAVASLFAFELAGRFPEAAVSGLVPTVFVVIVGTVAVYGLTISPLARRLGLAEPSAQGLLFIGGHPWALEMAKAVQDQGVPVVVIDTNARNVEQARKWGLRAERMNALSEGSLDELDLNGIGHLLAVTPNDEVNSLSALRFSEVFESSDVYQLPIRSPNAENASAGVPRHLRGRTLFDTKASFHYLTERFAGGEEIVTATLSDSYLFSDFQQERGGSAVLLFIFRNTGELLIQSPDYPLTPVPGDTVIALVPAKTSPEQAGEETPFERLVTSAPVIDVPTAVAYHDLLHTVTGLLSDRLDVEEAVLYEAFNSRWQSELTFVLNGVALPHCRLEHIGAPGLVLVRCRGGLKMASYFDGIAHQERVYAILFLVSDDRFPGRHLRILANISNRIADPDFMLRWRSAEDEQQLKEALFPSDRYVSVEVGDQAASPVVGRSIAQLGLPQEVHVALIARMGHVFIPDANTEIQLGDRLTVIGRPENLNRLPDLTNPSPEDVNRSPAG